MNQTANTLFENPQVDCDIFPVVFHMHALRKASYIEAPKFMYVSNGLKETQKKSITDLFLFLGNLHRGQLVGKTDFQNIFNIPKEAM